MNCGYYSTFTKQTGFVIVPLACINKISYGSSSRPIAGLPLQFITPVNDTNASRIIIGPVGEQFVGMTNFSCNFLIAPPLESVTVVLTVLGKGIFTL